MSNNHTLIHCILMFRLHYTRVKYNILVMDYILVYAVLDMFTNVFPNLLLAKTRVGGEGSESMVTRSENPSTSRSRKPGQHRTRTSLTVLIH